MSLLLRPSALSEFYCTDGSISCCGYQFLPTALYYLRKSIPPLRNSMTVDVMTWFSAYLDVGAWFSSSD